MSTPISPSASPGPVSIAELEQLYQTGQASQLISATDRYSGWDSSSVCVPRVMLLRGMAQFDAGDVVASIEELTQARSLASTDAQLQFEVSFALFLRASDFYDKPALLEHLTVLRQAAWTLGSARSIGSLHLAVARLEGIRGNGTSAQKHLEMSRRLLERDPIDSLLCSIGLVAGSLACSTGNLQQSRHLALECLDRSSRAQLSRYVLGASTNLALTALYLGHSDYSATYISEVLERADDITYVRLGALDTRAQVFLYDGDLEGAAKCIAACRTTIAGDRLPARSWYDLAHQLTRCAFYEQREDWEAVLETVDATEPELARRQYRALRASLICARARALAWAGRHPQAEAAVAAAVQCCPRGAVDPAIVLEATRAVCLSLAGDADGGARQFDRALSATRSIGHKYHERWIERTRTRLARSTRTHHAVGSRADGAAAALLLTDACTILGAGHSIDLLAHGSTSLLKASLPGAVVEVTSERGCEYQATPSAQTDIGTDGSLELSLRGSDRHVTIRVRDVHDLDGFTVVKSVSELVQASVARVTGGEQDDGESLWPQSLVPPENENVVFRSPRMQELAKIALRLASTDLPVLITGETGTGKEVFARLIHEHSALRRGPFVPFNCSAVPRELAESQLFGHRRGAFTGANDSFQGVVRSAERGTLFLDEVGDLEVSTQPKLLRFLESGEIHPVGEARPTSVFVRIVAATNADIDRRVAEGGFRADLFYRLGVARIALPPLRDRKEEIPALAGAFVARFCRECRRAPLRLGDDFLAALLLYNWPGNIRELSNEIRRAVAMAGETDTLSTADLGPAVAETWNRRPEAPVASTPNAIHIRLDQPLPDAMRQLEEEFVQHALAATGGKVTDAAQLLGVSRKGLFLKRRRQGLVEPPAAGA